MRIALASCRDLPDWEVDDAPLHEALRRRGAEVLCPAWDDGDFDWAACDACLIRTTWDYMERRDEFVAWSVRIARQTHLFNPPEIVRWNTHKSYLRDLEQQGAAVIPTVWLEAGQDVDASAIMRARGWARGFLKPVIGATARETLRFDADAEGLAAAQAHLVGMLARESMMLQPYFDSVETEGEISAIFFDGRFSHAVRKVPVPGDYRVQDDFGARDEPYNMRPGELEIARGVVGLVRPAPLYARVDFLRDHAGRLCCNELELVEPSLFFRHCPSAAHTLATCVLSRVAAARQP